MSTIIFTSEDIDHLQGAMRALLSPLDAAEVNEWRTDVNLALQKLFDTGQSSFTLDGADPVSFVAGLDPSFGHDYAAFYHAIDEGAELRRKKSLQVFNRAEIFENQVDSFHQSSRIYNDFYRPHQYNDVVGLWLEGPDGSQRLGGVATRAVITVAHHRYGTERLGDWGLAVMRLLQPALQAGVEAYIRFMRQRSLLERTLDAFDIATALFDRDGRLLHQNPPMTRLLESDVQKDLLSENILRAARAFTGPEWHSPGRRPKQFIPSVQIVETTGSTYQAKVCRLGSSLRGNDDAVLVTLEPFVPTQASRDYIRERFGLSRREAEIALLLAQRKRTAEIADLLCISIHTARRHTESIMAKLGVHSRLEVERALAFSRV